MKTYFTYWLRCVRCALIGPKLYWLWIACLLGTIGVGLCAYISQLKYGLIMTNMSDQVSWGAYIANFTFLVGIAASAVLLVFPTYVLHRKYVKEVALLGQLL